MRIPTFLVAALISLSSAGHLSAQEMQNQELRLNQWRELPEMERQAIVLASIEALFLASTKSEAVAKSIDQECLSSLTPLKVEKRLRKESEKTPLASFSKAFFSVATCAEDN